VSGSRCNSPGRLGFASNRDPYSDRAAGPKGQARKSLRLGLAGLRIRGFDPIAEASELPDHSRGALLLGLFGDGWAPFFVTDSLVQDQPDEPALPMGDGPDGLIVSQARDRAAIHDPCLTRWDTIEQVSLSTHLYLRAIQGFLKEPQTEQY
jgi:hypothetical protein